MRCGILLTCLMIMVTISLFHWSNLDLVIQDYCYNFTDSKWKIDASEPILKFIFYRGIKLSITVFGIVLLILYMLSFYFQALRFVRNNWPVVILSLIFVPVIVAGSKQFTNNYCPAQIERYQGSYPYVKLLENYPENFTQSKMGKCFPAGHATAGFALMSLYFVFTRPAYKLAGLMLGLSLGWLMGGYQMLKGAHYLSDTVFTMLASWLIILLIQLYSSRFKF